MPLTLVARKSAKRTAARIKRRYGRLMKRNVKRARISRSLYGKPYYTLTEGKRTEVDRRVLKEITSEIAKRFRRTVDRSNAQLSKTIKKMEPERQKILSRVDKRHKQIMKKGE